MPVLNPSELNIIVAVAGEFLNSLWPSLLVVSSTDTLKGGFLLFYGIVSVKIKQTWYLGEARKFPPVLRAPAHSCPCAQARHMSPLGTRPKP